MKKLFVFNGSGTLLASDVSGFRWLAREMGKEIEEKKHLEEYNRVKKKGPWGLQELTGLFRDVGQVEFKEKAKEFVKENLIKGAKELVVELKQRGYSVVFYSSDPVEICEIIKEELMLDDIYGNVLESKNGKFTGELLEKVDRYDRANRIRGLILRNNLIKDNIWIVGNSITSLPSRECGKFIAFNFKDESIKEYAEVVVEGRDLMRVLDSI